MSATVSQLTQGSLRIGVGLSAGSRNPDAWKKMMGQKPIPARLATLPDTKLNRKALLSSSLFQLAVAAFVVVLPLFFPQKLVTEVMYEVTPLLMPVTEVPVPPKPPVVKPKVKPVPPPPVVEPPPQPVQVAKILAPPKPMVAPKAVRPVPVQTPEAPKFDQPILEAKFEAPNNEPARPREPIKTGVISTGSAAPATLSPRPLDKVQTGGFGDPNGLPGNGDPNKRANIAHQGSPLLPGGPGYGNGTGGANGARGTVASAGFGNGVAVPPTGGGGGNRGAVQSGGFAAATSAPVAAPKKTVDAGPAVAPVEILAKPRPMYSEEARKLGLEGDVLVEVVFPASGPVKVIRVTKGLGHGLDESAIKAAQQIRFKPAMQSGMPVDFPAVVHIEFQLAY